MFKGLKIIEFDDLSWAVLAILCFEFLTGLSASEDKLSFDRGSAEMKDFRKPPLRDAGGK